jgi:FkbM family methyltransferase
MVTLPVLAGPTRGLKLRLDLVHKKEGAYLWGRYDSLISRQLRQIVQSGWTIWDCGTYLGFYTLLFSRLVGHAGTVVAIEPDERNLERTRLHAQKNGLQNVQYYNFAIGAPNTTATFFLSEDTNSHLEGTYVGDLRQKAEWHIKEVSMRKALCRCVSLDQAFFAEGLPKPDLIKIDIEGAEKEALTFAGELAVTVKPLFVIELHNPECDRAAWQFRERTGYRLFSIQTGLEHKSPELVQGTLLCIPS